MNHIDQRVSVVILTYNRADELRRTLQQMQARCEQAALIVVDNASTDGTAAMVAAEFPQARLIAAPGNMGGAGRNLGVQAASTPYVAFCDDDSWWQPGALSAAADLLDAHPNVAGVCGRILLGQEQIEDPVCAQMAGSPLPSDGLPGPALLGFVACAVVFRRQAYLDAGGYEQRFFVGGEEALLTLDLVDAGWHVICATRWRIGCCWARCAARCGKPRGCCTAAGWCRNGCMAGTSCSTEPWMAAPGARQRSIR